VVAEDGEVVSVEELVEDGILLRRHWGSG
jgi:hypothetical protein